MPESPRANAGLTRLYYWRWLKTAFRHSLGPIDLWAGLAGAALAVADHFLPEKQLITALAWQIPLWALGLIIIARLLLAPFWMAKEDAIRLAEFESKAELAGALSALADYLAPANEMMNRHIDTKEQLFRLQSDYNQWLKKLHAAISASLSEAVAKAFITMPSVLSASYSGVFNETHNDLKLRLNAYMDRLQDLIARYDRQNRS